MDRLEIHTLICKKDIELFISTMKLFFHYSNLDCDVIIHEDGSFMKDDGEYIQAQIQNCTVIYREVADKEIKTFLANHELCDHFRFAEHHTIFKIKLFDQFYFTKSHNILYIDADILFCKTPHQLINLIKHKVGGYLRDMSSAYCVPFRDEDNDESIYRNINAGLNYYPTRNHYNLNYIEDCLKILYDHGSRGATHPFLEQTCVAYMITQLMRNGIPFTQLDHPEYCVPTFGIFIAEHGLTALHLNSSPIIGKWRTEHYQYELNKLLVNGDIL